MQQYEIISCQSMGRIVAATVPYTQNELVCIGKSIGIAPIRDTHSVQISDHEHVYLDNPANLFSHSCEPNLYIMGNDVGAYSFYAVRNIQPGETLAFHYGMCESESIAVPVCFCGAPSCLGKPIGFKEVPPHVQAYLYKLGVAKYLREWYERTKQS